MKQKINKILVALDGSERSFRGLNEAIYLARQCGATITGLCVTPLYTINLGPLLTSLKNQTLKEAKKFMADAKKLCAQHGIVFQEKIIYGNESWEITEYASYKKFDLIVITSRGRGQMKGTFLGSVANDIIHKSKVPVLVVK
jgi:nucleotide-binding universal stress UspA family protein